MPQAATINSFPDVTGFMDKALAAEKGWEVIFETKDKAWAYRMRCYTMRDRELKKNQKIYEDGNPGKYATIYHNLVLRLKKVPEGYAVQAAHGEQIFEDVGVLNRELT